VRAVCPRSEGAHTIRWDGRDDGGRALASGMYMYRLRVGERVEARAAATPLSRRDPGITRQSILHDGELVVPERSK